MADVELDMWVPPYKPVSPDYDVPSLGIKLLFGAAIVLSGCGAVAALVTGVVFAVRAVIGG